MIHVTGCGVNILKCMINVVFSQDSLSRTALCLRLLCIENRRRSKPGDGAFASEAGRCVIFFHTEEEAISRPVSQLLHL